VDKAYIYFSREFGERSHGGLAEQFRVSKSVVTSICITWAKVCSVRFEGEYVECGNVEFCH